MRRILRPVLGGVVLTWLIGGIVISSAAAAPLKHYRWQNRVIVVLAGATGQHASDQQMRLLADEPGALAERDLVIVAAADGVVRIDRSERPDLQPADLRRAYDVPAEGFQVLLIGKDGGVKLRSDTPVPLAEFNALIDTMPMRRREMRSN